MKSRFYIKYIKQQKYFLLIQLICLNHKTKEREFYEIIKSEWVYTIMQYFYQLQNKQSFNSFNICYSISNSIMILPYRMNASSV